jgi:putative hemolysin
MRGGTNFKAGRKAVAKATSKAAGVEAAEEALLTRRDFAKLVNMHPRSPLVGLLQRFSGLHQVNRTYASLGHLEGDALVAALLSMLGVKLEVSEEDLARIPATGAFVVLSNHPFGAIDALALLSVFRARRPDFKVAANVLLGKVDQLDPVMTPGLTQAFAHVDAGGAIGAFPSGEVSSYQPHERTIVDRQWKGDVAKRARDSGADVLPVYIDGANSPLFQLLSLIHPALQRLRLPRELHNKQGHTLRLRIGRPIRSRELAGFDSDDQLSRFLRAKTYALGSALEVKREYFRGPKFPKRPAAIAAAQDPQALRQEMACIEDVRLFQHGEFSIYAAPAARIPHLLKEIGRLREITFRGVGEGTNRSEDLDEYDLYYDHLILWDHEAGAVVGAYRMGRGWDIMQRMGPRGFYTQSLFRIRRGFHPILRQSLELGRSFIVPSYQKKRMPLFLLWKGIVWVLMRSPEARYVIGPVTISSDYQKISRGLIIEFIRRHYYDEELAQFIRPRKAFHIPRSKVDADALLEAAEDNIRQLDKILADIELGGAVSPVLLKKYLKQNARILGFNRDPKFNNALDGLILLDVHDLPAETRENLQREFEG